MTLTTQINRFIDILCLSIAKTIFQLPDSLIVRSLTYFKLKLIKSSYSKQTLASTKKHSKQSLNQKGVMLAAPLTRRRFTGLKFLFTFHLSCLLLLRREVSCGVSLFTLKLLTTMKLNGRQASFNNENRLRFLRAFI